MGKNKISRLQFNIASMPRSKCLKENLIAERKSSLPFICVFLWMGLFK